MVKRQWVLRDLDPARAQTFAQALAISPITAAVLLGRGLEGLEDARSWITPMHEERHDPFLLPDMERAVDRIHQAITQKEPVCVYGDYDVDGISATSLHLNFFRQFHAQFSYYIPHRLTEGYGLNESAIRRLAKEGVKVLVTADCGTTSHHEIAVAQSLGLDVLITDHHQIQQALPQAVACLNPQREDSRYPFRGLCSGGLAFKFGEAYAQKYGTRGVDIHSFLDLVALASIADIVPLVNENRSLVRQGLAQLTEGNRCGVRALKQCMGITSACTAGTVGFRLAPVINAAGRLAEAKLGVQLLTTNSESEAYPLAHQLEKLNRLRREIELEIFEEAIRDLEEMPETPAIVIGSQTWHVGVVGIVASRLVERYHRPAVVVSFDQHGRGRGSVRGVPGIDVCRILYHCRELLEGFGGHQAAAGLTVSQERFFAFKEKFCDFMMTSPERLNPAPILHLDAQVGLSDIHPKLIRELELLHPFGMGNPEPTFLIAGVKVLERRVVGDDHLKLVVRHPQSVAVEGIGFRMGRLASQLPSSGHSIDLACIPELNHWKGYSRVQLRIRDIRDTPGTGSVL